MVAEAGATEHARLDAFFADGPWRDAMTAFRATLLDCGLSETLKWDAPVYVAHGGNICILWSFKDHCALGFFKGVLLEDPSGLLVAPGENSRSARKLVVTNAAEIDSAQSAIRSLVARAVAVERDGLKVTFDKDDLTYPQELVDALDADVCFREAWDGLTPGRRRGYVLTVAQAKKPETRAARIGKWRPRILQGRGMHDR